MTLNPAFDGLLDLLAEAVVREILTEKSHRSGEIQSGDKPDAIHREHLRGAA